MGGMLLKLRDHVLKMHVPVCKRQFEFEKVTFPKPTSKRGAPSPRRMPGTSAVGSIKFLDLGLRRGDGYLKNLRLSTPC
jgi:hypothetical protein